MENNDTIIFTDKNKNHLGYGVSAYANFKGKAVMLNDNLSFAIVGDSSELVVPISKDKPKVHLSINGIEGWYGMKFKTNVPLIDKLLDWL